MNSFITNRKFLGGIAVLGLLFLWQIIAWRFNRPLILPPPGETLKQLIVMLGTLGFWGHLSATMGRGLFGFSLSLLGAVLIGLAAGKSKTLETLLRPLIVCLRSTPSISFILLALIWFKGDFVPLFVIVLMVFPLIFQNIIEGVRSIDPELREVMTLYRVKRSRRFFKLYLPSLLPFLAAGVSSGLGITWKVSVAAEVFAYPAWGIGTQMDTARVYLQTDKVFAWTIAVIAIGLCFDYLVNYLLHRPFSVWKEINHV